MPNENNQAQNLLSVESLINSYNLRYNDIQKEFKENKGMLNAILENDDEYQKTSEEAGKLAKLKTVAKQKILQQPEAARLQDKIKELQMQIREIKTALSDYLSQYVSLSGSREIEGPDGVLRQIIYSAKLVNSKK